MSPCGEIREEKISGYDKWKIRNAVSTMREAAEIEADSKFRKVVANEMAKEAERDKKKANFLADVSAKLKKVFRKKK